MTRENEEDWDSTAIKANTASPEIASIRRAANAVHKEADKLALQIMEREILRFGITGTSGKIVKALGILGKRIDSLIWAIENLKKTEEENENAQ